MIEGGAKPTVLVCKDPDALSRDWKSSKQSTVPKQWGKHVYGEPAIHGGRVYKNIWGNAKVCFETQL